MARVQEFYKGRRKKKNLAIIPFIVLLALVSVTLVTFYGMQKYAVITKDGVSVELPILDDGSKQVTVDSQGNEVVNFEKVDANIVSTRRIIRQFRHPLERMYRSCARYLSRRRTSRRRSSTSTPRVWCAETHWCWR